MRLGSILLVCLSLFALSQNASAIQNAQIITSTAPTSAESARALLKESFSKFQDNDLSAALDGFRELVSSPGFELLSDREKHASRLLLGTTEMRSGNAEAALKILRISTQSPDAIGMEWYLRLGAAYAVKDYADSINSLTIIAQKWPGSLSQIKDFFIFDIADKAAQKSDASAIALLEPLHQLHWKPKDRFETSDQLWLQLGIAYAGIHDQVHEIAALSDVNDPVMLIEIRSDKRFDFAVRANPLHYDVGHALEARVASEKQLSSQNPDFLEGVDAVADVLIQLNRPTEALAVVDDALAREKQTPHTFEDFDDNLNWAYDYRARAFSLLGRHREELAQLEDASRVPEHGAVNVSQMINLADAYESAGRPEDALKLFPALEMAKQSPYGRMAMENARACAYAQLHDTANLQKSLSYMEEHAADGRGTLLDTLICANDTDGAAKLVISELQDPATRVSVLYLLQDFRDNPGASAIDKQNRFRLRAVRDRPDVARAIAATGRISSYPVFPPGT